MQLLLSIKWSDCSTVLTNSCKYKLCRIRRSYFIIIWLKWARNEIWVTPELSFAIQELLVHEFSLNAVKWALASFYIMSSALLFWNTTAIKCAWQFDHSCYFLSFFCWICLQSPKFSVEKEWWSNNVTQIFAGFQQISCISVTKLCILSDAINETKCCQLVAMHWYQLSQHLNKCCKYQFLELLMLPVTMLPVLYGRQQVSDSSLKSELTASIKPTLDYLMTLKFPSGNYPSSVGSASGDLLVHWCHGAPGWIHLFALAYKVCLFVWMYTYWPHQLQ